MGRIIGLDKIGALSHSAGTITLGPSLVTIGGQQYRILSSVSRAIASDVTMAVNTRYQIFAVLVGGVVALRISASENSAGPAGFTSWKLIGSFYSNATPTFGALVSIEGAPRSDVLNQTSFTNFIETTSGTIPGNGSEYNVITWNRDGGDLIMRGIAAGTWASNGTALQFHLLPIPSNMLIDNTRIRIDPSLDLHRQETCGNGAYANNNATSLSRTLMITPHSTTRLKAGASQPNGSLANLRKFGPSETSLSSGFNDVNYNARLPIVGWNNTPIVNL